MPDEGGGSLLDERLHEPLGVEQVDQPCLGGEDATIGTKMSFSVGKVVGFQDGISGAKRPVRTTICSASACSDLNNLILAVRIGKKRAKSLKTDVSLPAFAWLLAPMHRQNTTHLFERRQGALQLSTVMHLDSKTHISH